MNQASGTSILCVDQGRHYSGIRRDQSPAMWVLVWLNELRYRNQKGRLAETDIKVVKPDAAFMGALEDQTAICCADACDGKGLRASPGCGWGSKALALLS